MAGPYSERSCPEFQERYGPTVGDCSEEFPLPGWFWVLGFPDMEMIYVPVPIDDRGFARSWADVYELACRHPQLGGTALTIMAEAEVEALGHWGDGWYRSEGPAPNGGTNKYLLPTLSAETLDLMTIEGESGMCGPASSPVATEATTTTSSSTATEPSERQRWKIFVWGHERTGFDPATPSIRPRAGVRFDYRLYGEFVVERSEPEHPWRYVSGQVTDAKIDITPIYERPELWEMNPYDCRGCDRVIEERNLPVAFVGANDILVKWGSVSPSVNIEARLCPPTPSAPPGARRTSSRSLSWAASVRRCWSFGTATPPPASPATPASSSRSVLTGCPEPGRHMPVVREAICRRFSTMPPRRGG